MKYLVIILMAFLAAQIAMAAGIRSINCPPGNGTDPSCDDTDTPGADPLHSPIVDMTTNITLSNGTTIEFTGTIQELMDWLEKNDPASLNSTAAYASAADVGDSSSSWETWMYEDLECTLGVWVETWKIMGAAIDLRKRFGTVLLEGACKEVSCKHGAKINACTNMEGDDKDEPVEVAWDKLADMAGAVALRFCNQNGMTRGMASDQDDHIAVYITRGEC